MEQDMSTKRKYFGVSGRAHTRAIWLRLKRKRNRYISRPRPLKGLAKKLVVRESIALRHLIWR